MGTYMERKKRSKQENQGKLKIINWKQSCE